MTGDIPQEELEAGYPQGMPRYIRHTSGIPFTYVKQLMRFRTGAHHLAIETEQGIKLLGLLLTGSTGQHMASRNGLA